MTLPLVPHHRSTKTSKFPSCSPCCHPLVVRTAGCPGGAVSSSSGTSGNWTASSQASCSSALGVHRNRSEERRVGKEGDARRVENHVNKEGRLVDMSGAARETKRGREIRG